MATPSRKAEVLALHEAGVSLDEIAERLGYKSSAGAAGVLTQALKDVGQFRRKGQPAQAQPDADTAAERERLLTMREAIWPDAAAGKLSAIDRVLRIDARLAQLGSDVPSSPPQPAPSKKVTPVAKFEQRLAERRSADA